jgi:hypothetical protein
MSQTNWYNSMIYEFESNWIREAGMYDWGGNMHTQAESIQRTLAFNTCGKTGMDGEFNSFCCPA